MVCNSEKKKLWLEVNFLQALNFPYLNTGWNKGVCSKMVLYSKLQELQILVTQLFHLKLASHDNYFEIFSHYIVIASTWTGAICRHFKPLPILGISDVIGCF